MNNITQIDNKITTTQNSNIMSQIIAANKCIQVLMKMGLTVLAIKIEESNPRIDIQHCNKCASLGGLSHITRPKHGGFESEYVAPYMNCRVKWVVKH